MYIIYFFFFFSIASFQKSMMTPSSSRPYLIPNKSFLCSMHASYGS